MKVLHSLEIDSLKSVIDCGFGDGYFLDFFQTNFSEWDVFGLDISENAINKVSTFFENRKLRVIDLTSQIEIEEMERSIERSLADESIPIPEVGLGGPSIGEMLVLLVVLGTVVIAVLGFIVILGLNVIRRRRQSRTDN